MRIRSLLRRWHAACGFPKGLSMKRKLFAALLLASSAPAFAQESAGVPAPYFELGVGVDIVPTVSTQTYTITSGTTTATGRVDLDYDTGLAGGAELGYAGVGIPELRLGVGYDYLEATFRSGQVVGTVNGTPGTFSFSRAGVASLGASLDNDVHLVTGNAYYSLPMVGPIRPYFGVGVGSAFIQNAGSNLAVTATAGFRWAMTDQAYMGLRYRFYRVEGPTDDIGIKYESIMTHSVMAMLGVYMD
jgi:opacity protein-like surface antigen